MEGFLYRNRLEPAAWLNPDGSIRAMFVYAVHANVPEFMIQGPNTYRIITDQVGSVRLVVNASSGAVAERVDWDEFGRLISDTSPGLQPFGFAGGLRDVDTGLTRFGARDYEPSTGRWTNKDLIRFSSADMNLYGYVSSDPINANDISGLSRLVFSSGLGKLVLLSDDYDWIDIWDAGNRTTNPAGDPYAVGSDGPAPEGTFPIQPPVATNGAPEYGPYFFPVGARGPHGERLDIARQRGIGVHGGRRGPQSRTQGCIRVADDTASILYDYYQLDPIREIIIQ